MFCSSALMPVSIDVRRFLPGGLPSGVVGLSCPRSTLLTLSRDDSDGEPVDGDALTDICVGTGDALCALLLLDPMPDSVAESFAVAVCVGAVFRSHPAQTQLPRQAGH